MKHLCVGDFCRETVRSWGNRKLYHPTPAALCSLPHPSCAHPSPAMGGELDTTCCPFGSPPQTAGTLASSAPHPKLQARWLTRLPTPMEHSGRSFGSPPQLRSPLPCDGRGVGYHRLLFRLPTPMEYSGRSFGSPPL